MMVETKALTSFERGVTAARAGNKLLARLYLLEAVEHSPRNVDCWLWLAYASETPDDAFKALAHVLAITPGHDVAMAGWNWLRGLTGEEAEPPAPSPAPMPTSNVWNPSLRQTHTTEARHAEATRVAATAPEPEPELAPAPDLEPVPALEPDLEPEAVSAAEADSLASAVEVEQGEATCSQGVEAGRDPCPPTDEPLEDEGSTTEVVAVDEQIFAEGTQRADHLEPTGVSESHWLTDHEETSPDVAERLRDAGSTESESSSGDSITDDRLPTVIDECEQPSEVAVEWETANGAVGYLDSPSEANHLIPSAHATSSSDDEASHVPSTDNEESVEALPDLDHQSASTEAEADSGLRGFTGFAPAADAHVEVEAAEPTPGIEDHLEHDDRSHRDHLAAALGVTPAVPSRASPPEKQHAVGHERGGITTNTTTDGHTANGDGDARGRQSSILVVDDSPTICKLVSITLSKRGYQVRSAPDGLEAMTSISQQKPDLILLDITMPHLDGYRLCKLVKGHPETKHIPVIMLSGKDGFFDKVRGKLVGCTDYITKPFDPDVLLTEIEKHLPLTASALH